MSNLLVTTASWLLCMTAAVVIAAHPAQRSGQGVMLAGVALGSLVAYWVPPQPGWIGIAVAVSAMWMLLRGVNGFVACLLAGVFSGLAAMLHAGQGLPVWAALIPNAALPLLASSLARHDYFASSRMRQQALVGLTWLAPCLAAAPSIIDGWHSAQALTRTVEASTDQTMPPWIWPCALTALLLGFLRGVWGRR